MQMSEEEKAKIEEKSFEHQKKRMVEEIHEKSPEWLMYCVLNDDPNVLSRFDR
jgi:catalase